MNLLLLNKNKTSSEQGLTLLEVIASIVMISVILVAIAPPLLLSVATRVKMRRASQAMLIAQEEVNRVQGIMARSRDENLPTESDDCDPTESVCSYVGLPQTIGQNTNLKDFSAPDSNSELEEFDVDDDGNADFFVQTFRDQGALFAGGGTRCEPAVFGIGVRVYSTLAEDNLQSGNLETEEISLQMTSGLKGQSTKPMTVLFATVSRSDMGGSLDTYQDYINNNATPDDCP